MTLIWHLFKTCLISVDLLISLYKFFLPFPSILLANNSNQSRFFIFSRPWKANMQDFRNREGTQQKCHKFTCLTIKNGDEFCLFCTSNFHILHISQLFSFYPRREMTCFAISRRFELLPKFFHILSTDLQSGLDKFNSTIVDSLFANQTNWKNREISVT